MVHTFFRNHDLLAQEELKAEKTISTVRLMVYAVILAANIAESIIFSLPLLQSMIVYGSGWVIAFLMHLKIIFILKNFSAPAIRILVRYVSIVLDIAIICLAIIHNLDVLSQLRPNVQLAPEILPVCVTAVCLIVLLMDIFSFNMGSSFFAGGMGAISVFLFPWITFGCPYPFDGIFTYTHILLAGLILICSAIAALVSNSFRSIVLKSRRQQDLERFLSPVIARRALDGTLKLVPGGQLSDISVLFSDIRGFTSFAENHTPEETVELLNEYFSLMIPVVFRHEGSLDKLLGDGLMAFFGVPEPKKTDRQNAFNAACEMMDVLEKWNKERTAAGKETVSIGIGLDGGKVIIGNLGTDRHLEFTAIGDPVNTASRIQSLTRTTNETLLFSEYIFSGLPQSSLAVSKGFARLKGKEEPVKIYARSNSSKNQHGKSASDLS